MDYKTVFLDIDGVLNTKESWKKPFQLNDDCISRFCNTLLNQKAPINIILTSSWKNGYSSIPENESLQLKELRAKLSSFGLNISGRTKSLQNRMQEIDEYISNHDISCYSIIDDDENEYSKEYLKKVTLIDSDKGFSNQKIKWNQK